MNTRAKKLLKKETGLKVVTVRSSSWSDGYIGLRESTVKLALRQTKENIRNLISLFYWRIAFYLLLILTRLNNYERHWCCFHVSPLLSFPWKLSFHWINMVEVWYNSVRCSLQGGHDSAQHSQEHCKSRSQVALTSDTIHRSRSGTIWPCWRQWFGYFRYWHKQFRILRVLRTIKKKRDNI